MNIETINNEIEKFQQNRLIVQSYDIKKSELKIAFTNYGGLKESKAYVVVFSHVLMFHLPTSINEAIRLKKTSEKEREKIIPKLMYDPDELTGEQNAYTVLSLAANNNNTGFYIVAEKITMAKWLPAEECRWIW